MFDRTLRFNSAVLLAFPAALLMLAATAPALRAELVVLENGRVLKVVSHRDVGDRIQIRFSGGGSLTFDRSLVERIEEDEVAGADAQAPPVQAPPQPPRNVETSRPAMNEQVATPTEPQVSPDAPKASEEPQPAHETRRSRRRHR